MVRPEEGELTSLLERFRRDLPAIFRAAIDASSTPRLVDRALDAPLLPGLQRAPSVRLIAVGKAAPFMAAAFAARSVRRPDEAVVVGTHCPLRLPEGYRWMPAGHPVPDERSAGAAEHALAVAARVPPDGVLLVLVSGGASALLAAPAEELSLADKQAATRRLLCGGADIHQLNAVRKHLSRIKGGRLAAACAGRSVALLVSDVVGDDPSVIGSGPTVGDPSTFEDAWAAVNRCGGREAFPTAVVERLGRGLRGEVAETPKPGSAGLSRADTRVIGSRATASEGARRAAVQRGYAVEVFDDPVVGEARLAGRGLAGIVRRRLASVTGPTCLVWSGETTVTVKGRGRGGRNQELALAVALALESAGCHVFLSGGTDGIDGPTDAAGALVDSTTLARARERGGRDAREALDDNDSYGFFGPLGDLVVTGPTDTNVGDIQLCLIAPGGSGREGGR